MERKKENIEWDSCIRDKIQRKYWAGVVKYQWKIRREKCMSVRAEDETEVEHILRSCSGSAGWRKDWEIVDGDDVVEIIANRAEALVRLECLRE